jgi:hypothetical protein
MRWARTNANFHVQARIYIPMSERTNCLTLTRQAFLTGCRRLRARVRSWAVFGNSASRREASAWSGRLTDEKDSLLSLVHGMEKEFLSTGDGLERLSRQLGDIRRECQSLTELTLGQSQDAAVKFAFQLLKKAEDLMLASYEQYDQVFASFSELQERLARVSQQRDELMRVLLPLNFITTAFRIEASRHPAEVQQAFFTLADSVNRTVAEVRSTMERQFDELAASQQMALRLIGQISASVQQHRKEVSSTLAATRSQLSALGKALLSSGAGATNLVQRNQAVKRQISSMVMALQCQDITRQRIEHVGEAMDEMRAHLADQSATPARNAEMRHFVFHAGQIQLQQVQSVFDELNQAADTLKSGIQNLRSEAVAAAELAVRVGGTTQDANVASQCQAGIGKILGIMAQAVDKTAQIIAAFEPLQASFVDCTGKATALASDVRRAGLNAQVFAIHAPDGATLEVLAGRVHVISEEVIQQVARMGTSLNHTSETINNLRQRLEDFQLLCQAEEEVLTAESAVSRDKLADLEQAIPVQIRGVTGRQEIFAGSVEEVLANIQFPVTVAQASSRSIGFFQDLVAWGRAVDSGFLAETAAARRIDRLKSNYTMASERHAHAAALQPALAPASAGAAESALELFDDGANQWSTGGPPASSPGYSIERFDDSGSDAPAAAGAMGEIPRPGTPGQASCAARQPLAGGPAASGLTPPPPADLPARETSAASAGLGDNVELF